jgi:HEPN domain-containing protein
MIDKQKQIDYWRKGAAEEWALSVDLFVSGRLRHGLFYLHLTLEKVIKAHVCKKTGDIAPKDHNLVRLSDKATLPILEEDRSFLAAMTRFNIEGRYPDFYEELPSDASVMEIRRNTERIYKWLLEQL